MQTRVSSKGQVVLPARVRNRLNIRSGDALDISIERDRIVLIQPGKPKCEPRIVQDPITGFTAIDLGPDAPMLTSEMVRELLVDFP